MKRPPVPRTATPADIGAIAALHAANWRVGYRGLLADEYLDGDLLGERLQAWTERFARPERGQLTAVAEAEDGSLAGFVCVYPGFDPRWGSHVESLHVADGFKGQGLGAQLMRLAAQWCAVEAPGQGLCLNVLEANVAARRFYERLGAVNAEAGVWAAPDGGSVGECRYAWPSLAPLLNL